MAGAFDAGTVTGRLVLDLKEWTGNMEKAKRDTTALANTVEKNKAVIEDMGKAFTAAGAAITLALGSALKKGADYGDMLAKTSQKTGIAVETLSGLKLAADLSDLSIEGLAAGLAKMSRTMNDAQQGSKEAQEAFRRLGITVIDSSGKMKPMDMMLGEVADKFQAMPDGVEKSAMAMDIFGKAGVQMIPFLNQGSKGLKDTRAEAERLGIVMSGPAAKASEAFNDQITKLKTAFLGIAVAISQSLMPIVKGVVDIFTFAVVVMRKLSEIFPPLGAAITVVVGAFGSLMAVVGPLMLALPTMLSAKTKIAAILPVIGTRVAALSAKMSLSLPIYAAVLAAILAINAGAKAYGDHCDKWIAWTVKTTEESVRGWKYAQASMKGLTTVTAEEMRKIIDKQREMGRSSEQIGTTIAQMFAVRISKAAKQAAKDTEEMAATVIDIQREVTDKIKELTLGEYDFRIYQAARWRDDIILKSKDSVDAAKVAADAQKAYALEVSKIRREQAEAAAAAQAAAAIKSEQAGKDQWARWEKDGENAGDSIQQTYLKVQAVAIDTAKFIASTFGISFGKIVSQGKDAAPKVQSSFSKAMNKIDGYVQVIQQGFGQFFSAIQSKSDNYYKNEFAKLDKLYQKQKDSLAKEYNAKIAALDAKDAAENLAARKKEILLSDMTEAEKKAALNEIDIEQAKIAERAAIDAEYAAAQEALELEQTAKRKELEKKQAEANKKSAIVQSVINMAAAITASWKLGWPLGAIAAAIAGAMCLIQINAIKSTPIPEMAEGGLVNRPTTVLAGEAGPEAILPMRELRRMLGTERKGGGGSKTIQVNISAIDTRGMEGFTRRSIIPEIKRALANESFTISPNAVR